MYESIRSELSSSVDRYRLVRDGRLMRWAQVLEGWEGDAEFRTWFNQVLREVRFAAFLWETPGIGLADLESKFEFVVCDAPRLQRRADAEAFREHFEGQRPQGTPAPGVVAFDTLGRDARLVVPVPKAPSESYPHLAAFCRRGPADQCDEFWRVVGEVLRAELTQPRSSTGRVWLNTHGGGVAWLHVRLDSTPKYYEYVEYKRTGANPFSGLSRATGLDEGADAEHDIDQAK